MEKLFPDRLGVGNKMIDLNRVSDITSRLARAEATVDMEIHPKDNMLSANQRSAYTGIGRRGLHEIASALIQSPETSYSSILDFPSGWGRVARWIRAAFPESDLSFSDIIPGAADFCAERFKGTAYSSQPDFSRVDLGRTFDVIWVGSLVTHLKESSAKAFFTFATRHLSENGVLIVTLHGRKAVANGRLQRQLTAFRREEDMEQAAQEFERGNYSYGAHVHMDDYGHSFTPLQWVANNIPERTVIYGYKEKGWNNHQDVLILRKSDI
jgi:SAM-dependent methyltransferase